MANETDRARVMQARRVMKQARDTLVGVRMYRREKKMSDPREIACACDRLEEAILWLEAWQDPSLLE